MARKNFRATGGIDIDTSAIPTSIIQETITSNSATTVDTIALNSFLAAEYTVTLTQGSKIRTSKVIMQTDGSSVDMTEFAITETGGTMSGVVVSATTASTNAVLQITVTDAASTLVRYKLVRNITTLVGYAPDAPTIGTATTTGITTASVTFTAPADNGGSTITSYTVTSNPGNVASSGSSSPITVTGLSAATQYTFTVTATNVNGTSAASSASNQITTDPSPVVTGGTLTTDGTYFYRTFTSSGTLSVTSGSINATYIMGGGGGGGGGRFLHVSSGGAGGGGGAGGFRAPASATLSGNYTITIGAGGAGSANPGWNGDFGTSTTFNSVTAGGGGRGGGAAGQGGNGNQNGGSGGGAGGNTSGGGTQGGAAGSLGLTSAGGNSGGSGPVTGGGGGGGASGAGAFGSTGTGGAAYSGLSTWTSTTGIGVDGAFCGGGGGGFYSSNASASGGGGGAGGTTAGAAASANSGSGGAGGASVNQLGGNGGSGFVIVRYQF